LTDDEKVKREVEGNFKSKKAPNSIKKKKIGWKLITTFANDRSR